MAYPLSTAFHLALQQNGTQPATIKNYDTTINQFFTFLENDRQLGGVDNLPQIQESDLRAFFDQQTITTGTFNKKLSHLNQYFLFLVDHGVINSFPTLALHGQAITKQSTTTNWLDYYPNLLSNEQLSMYGRVTIFLLARGFEISEILSPDFWAIFNDLQPVNQVETTFLAHFKEWLAPLQKLQGEQQLFLKQRIDRRSPRLSLPALHKYLRADQQFVAFPLSPQKMHQAYILTEIKKHPELSQSELCQRLRISPASLNYYQSLLLN
ncbi:winged helix-turn-helix transcriptional regulator [Limosilactobacillus caecicola]|uniref:winged helix-turn-helix transcriptional regulator n=1 Tax=Limosilactobacillus caecicola TaxID=2941332 RepID=UPI002042183F|nr:winged helix-turn-helix transcriptional regulator [Limosilactobacillus caecicola]